ncbi:hypothetical protein ZOSMA_185G00290 [Zostera marina]|uniref:ALIX V-shaped domain-containing protein n=1 Tax=Zostera marina TaxID=29655 RepID=A0A0K9PSL1_ZOSMR|nr:hypothetical protein ZOSMA_185G00290 [Zostera marina]
MALKSDFEDYKVSIEKRCYEVATAMVKFWEIKENINQGLSFYIALQDAIKNSKQTCSDFVMSRNIESEGMLEGLHKNMGGLHISSNRRQTGRRNR